MCASSGDVLQNSGVGMLNELLHGENKLFIELCDGDENLGDENKLIGLYGLIIIIIIYDCILSNELVDVNDNVLFVSLLVLDVHGVSYKFVLSDNTDVIEFLLYGVSAGISVIGLGDVKSKFFGVNGGDSTSISILLLFLFLSQTDFSFLLV